MILKFTLILLISILIRYLVGIHSHSGQGKPPMFGDYEAQRHWMEITTKLPVHEWYFNTTNNDLMYWGLDYPPLTAYISWAFGKAAEIIEPQSMELYKSRGYETETSKMFMRMTVIVSDLVIWIPSVYFFINTIYKDKPIRQKFLAFLFISLQPGLLLIDHGHFQYNGISLGLALFGITYLFKNQIVKGSIFFVLSLNYKQMSLYYAPAFFFYLLFSNLNFNNLKKSILNIGLIGITVILTFLICWLPFLSIEQASQVLHRLFPFARGLYEDKVANFWCFISVFINLKKLLNLEQVLRLCTISTLIGFSPLIFSLFKSTRAINSKNTKEIPNDKMVFLYSLINSSFSFFLFSFQVHEKSILLVVLPISLLILEHPLISWWFGIISTFSMFPLLFKDGLLIPYISVMSIYIIIGYQLIYELNTKNNNNTNRFSIQNIFIILSILGCIVIHFIYEFTNPPANLPYLFLLLVCCYSFIHFMLILIYFIYQMISRSIKSNKLKTN